MDYVGGVSLFFQKHLNVNHSDHSSLEMPKCDCSSRTRIRKIRFCDLEILRKFAENLPLKDLGFTNITKIFQARRYSELQEQFYGSLWVYLSEC